MARPVSRIAVGLLTLCQLGVATLPCGRDARSAAPATTHEHVLADPAAAPCHGPGAEARTWLEPRCPCGCGDLGSPPAGQPRLGAALLSHALAWNPPQSESELSSAPARLPEAPDARIEHVPIAA
jgi:hypothetical protein